MANIVDLEQWPQSVPYDLGLYSLLRSVCPNIYCNQVHENLPKKKKKKSCSIKL